jgi:hypothetical protein
MSTGTEKKPSIEAQAPQTYLQVEAGIYRYKDKEGKVTYYERPSVNGTRTYRSLGHPSGKQMKKRKKTKPSPRSQDYHFEQLNALADLVAVLKFRAVGHAYQSRQICLEQAEKFLLADRNTADVLLRISYTSIRGGWQQRAT